MRIRYVFASLVGLSTILVFQDALSAAPPWAPRNPFAKPSVEVEGDFTLTEDHGPWLIVAKAFSGNGAAEKAKALVYDLRKDHSLKAYTHVRVLDLTERQDGRGIDRYGQQKRMRFLNAGSGKVEQVAVLIGDYESVDAPALQDALKTVRQLKPASLKQAAASRGIAEQTSRLNQHLQRRRAQKGPLAKAFVSTNPLMPDSYYVPEGVDRFVEDMNRGVKYSLLDNAGRFTLCVATFRGDTMLDKPHSAAAANSSTITNRLVEAADKAHRLTVALRAKGYQAYEFHDRHQSIVAVGSFDSLGTKMRDGSTKLHSDIHSLVKLFSAGYDSGATSGISRSLLPNVRPQLAPKKLLGIPFDVDPLPIKVPKRSIASDYARH